MVVWKAHARVMEALIAFTDGVRLEYRDHKKTARRSGVNPTMEAWNSWKCMEVEDQCWSE